MCVYVCLGLVFPSLRKNNLTHRSVYVHVSGTPADSTCTVYPPLTPTDIEIKIAICILFEICMMVGSLQSDVPSVRLYNNRTFCARERERAALFI
jgi:hypothetical protein